MVVSSVEISQITSLISRTPCTFLLVTFLLLTLWRFAFHSGRFHNFVFLISCWILNPTVMFLNCKVFSFFSERFVLYSCTNSALGINDHLFLTSSVNNNVLIFEDNCFPPRWIVFLFACLELSIISILRAFLRCLIILFVFSFKSGNCDWMSYLVCGGECFQYDLLFCIVIFFKIFFLTWTTVKVCIEYVTIWILIFTFGFLAARNVRTLVPRRGSNPRTLRWKAKS